MKVPEILIEIYTEAIKLAHKSQQLTGEENNYYITLEQLEAIIKYKS